MTADPLAAFLTAARARVDAALERMLPSLEFGAELGFPYALAIADDPDWSRQRDNFAALCDAARTLGMTISLEAPVGQNANVMFNLYSPNGSTGSATPLVASGSITNSNNLAVSLDSLRVLFNNGNAYVNVHTSLNPGGEIRGQISRAP